MKLTLENRQHNKIKEKLFYLGILTIITIVLWIILSIYVSFSKTSIDPKMTELTIPLNPTLDSKALIEYEASRMPAPEQFQITVFSRNENQKTTSTKIIDPFNTEQTVSVDTSPDTSTPSATDSL